MLVAFEIHEADFLFVTAADAARRRATIHVASAGFLADFHKTFFRLRLCNIAEVRERNVSRGRRQRSKCLHWHKINNPNQVSYLESRAINPAPRRAVQLSVLQVMLFLCPKAKGTQKIAEPIPRARVF